MKKTDKNAKTDKNMIKHDKQMIKTMIPEMIKKNEDDKINDKTMNAMITKMRKTILKISNV